jgi:twitching motility two-component system response regulator PilG
MSISNQPELPNSSSDPKSKGQMLRDPFQLLANLSQLPGSGKLTVFRGNISWEIYVANRQLQAAFLSVQSLESLYYNLQSLNYKNTVVAVKKAIQSPHPDSPLDTLSIDKAINRLKQQNTLNREQVSQITQKISEEAIEPFFWLNNGRFQWEEIPSTRITMSIAHPPQLTDLVKQGRDRIQSWQELLDQIQSPYQRPYLFNSHLVENSSHQFLAKLSQLMRGFSFHQIALILKKDEINLAKRLYPYLESGEIILREAKPPWNQLPNLPKLPQAQSNSDQNRKQKRF